MTNARVRRALRALPSRCNAASRPARRREDVLPKSTPWVPLQAELQVCKHPKADVRFQKTSFRFERQLTAVLPRDPGTTKRTTVCAQTPDADQQRKAANSPGKRRTSGSQGQVAPNLALYARYMHEPHRTWSPCATWRPVAIDGDSNSTSRKRRSLILICTCIQDCMQDPAPARGVFRSHNSSELSQDQPKFDHA